MSGKRFTYGETDLFEWVEDNGKMISTKECVNELNALYEENDNCRNDYRELFSDYVALEEENEQLRKQVAEYEMILRQHEFAEKEGFK